MAGTARIVVAHASVGSGHRIAAEAVARELTHYGPDAISVETVDALAFGKAAPSGETLTSSFTGPTAKLYDAIWPSATLGGMARVVGTPVLAWAFRRFTQMLLAAKPDAVVCTHALPALLATRAVRKGHLRTKVVCVSTDFGVHGMWPRRDVSLFCAADEVSAQELERREFDAVSVTGIPVRPQFTLEYDVSAARQHFGLPEGKRIVLALAGSSMPGPYTHFKEALATALPALASLPGVHLAIVTGNDDAFAEELRVRAAGFGVTTVHPLGFVEHMGPLMACSDVALAKPGGLVCAECVDMGLPLVLVGPAAGQERANATALAAAGAALFADDPRLLSEYARKAISRPHRLAKMREAAQALARPYAAADVAKQTLALIGMAPQLASERAT